jgi:hypothetical protein
MRASSFGTHTLWLSSDGSGAGRSAASISHRYLFPSAQNVGFVDVNDGMAGVCRKSLSNNMLSCNIPRDIPTTSLFAA